MDEQRLTATGLKVTLALQGRKARWLAARVGLSESFLSRVIHGERTIGRSEAQRIATVLEVPIEKLFEVTSVTEMITEEERIA